ncbi:hypothetical protein AVEN_168710-1 [Araneus ventricosus]|uniref:Uncharacterized protein n=1 Tax=Araneus ventricosus TaxID=182803 RepID=A0A4Y2P4M2_ARAVE|nr:hypothetical protein AVEN_168710-1 [Araneus ventricosus]
MYWSEGLCSTQPHAHRSRPCTEVAYIYKKLRPVSASHHSSDDHSFVHPDLHSASRVFIRRVTIRRLLEQPYKVLRRKEKFFYIEINGKEATVSIDQLKPAYFLVDPSTPHPSFLDHRSNPVSDSVVTRSGRRVRLTTPFQLTSSSGLEGGPMWQQRASRFLRLRQNDFNYI